MNQPNEQATQVIQNAQPGPAQGAYQAYHPAYPAYPAYAPVPQPAAPAFAQRLKDPRKSGALRTLNTMGLVMVAQTALSLLLQLGVMMALAAGGIDLYGDNMGLVMLSIGLSAVCTTAPSLTYMLAGRRDWNFHLRFGGAGFLGCLLAVLAGLGVCMAANIPAGMLSELLKDMGASEAGNVLGQGSGWVSFAAEFLGVAVMVPVLEEFAFRGVILSGLRRYGTGFAIVCSSVIFGMAHMSASSVVFATIAGLAMGTAYVLTGNLWVSVTIHALNNGISIVESYSGLFVGEGPGRQEMLSGLTMLIVCAVGLLALVLVIAFRGWLFPKREPVAPADGVLYAPLRAGETAVTMLKSVVLWAILAMVLVETAMTFVI